MGHLRTNRKLGMGLVHCWECTLDVLDTGQYNTHRIFVGIEPSTFAFTEVRNDRIIGLHSSGIGYSIGENSIYVGHKREAVDISLCEDYQTGDKIAIKLDLKNLGNSRTASMYLFKNDEYFHTIADIPTQGILYYPAISVIGPHTVSIRTKHASMLTGGK